jgi:nucleoside-diphosphate-sugar epimerase
MRCLVTGAAGHIGAAVARRLVNSGHEVAVLVRPACDTWRLAAILPNVRVIYSDLYTGTPASEFQDWHATAVFNMAWEGVSRSTREAAANVDRNVYGTLKFLDAVVEAGCRTWVGIGSQAEYGPRNGPLTEETPTYPSTGYGVAKLCAGHLTRLRCLQAGVRHVWLRLLATYGPEDDPHHLIPEAALALFNHKCEIATDGGQLWDYLYVDDAAAAIVAAATTPNVDGFFVLSSDAAFTVRSIVERLRGLIDPDAEIIFGRLSPTRQPDLMGNSSRLRSLTKWTPKVSIDAGLSATLEWLRENRWRYVRTEPIASNDIQVARQ